MRFTLRISFLLMLIFMLLPTHTKAQTGQITGTVSDSSGGAVPDASVTATNTATGIDRGTKTSETGAYNLPTLDASVYLVTVAKPGFKTVKFTDVTLHVDQFLTIDAKLDPSSVETTVTVEGDLIAPVDFQNAELSNEVDARQTKALPLILRDPYQLVLLGPGVIQSNTRLGGFSVNGQREQNNNFLLDGVDNNDTDVPGIAGGLNSLNPDSVQEFRVITNNFGAEYGRDNGAVIDVKTPSGSNAIHGSAYWFGRYSALGARDYFNHEPGSKKDPYVRNTFGASAGGPIIHDKTFWFANYEGNRFVTNTTATSTVPTDAFKTGIFSYRDANGVVNNIDVSTPTSPNNGTGLVSSSGASFGLDPTVQKILALYPSPTPGAGGPNDATGFLNFASASRAVNDDFTIRVDHQLSKNNALFVRYAFNRSTDPDAFHDDFLPGIGNTAIYQRTQNAGIGLTTTLTPTVVNEFRFGGNRTNLQFNCNGTKLFDSFGFVDTFGRGADFSLPGISGFGCVALGESNGQARFTGTYQANDHITWTRGNHTMKFGGEFRDIYSNAFDNFGTRSLLSFDPADFGVNVLQQGTGANTLTPEALTDRTLNNLVAGLLGFNTIQSQTQNFNKAGTSQANDERGFRQRELGVFAEDAWKVRPNLTLTFGLRYEYFGVPWEVNGNFSTLFADSSGAAPFTFTDLTHGGPQLYKDYYFGFDPRLAFAWDPFKTGKTSVRGGYGIFRDRLYGNLFENAKGNPPFVSAFNNFPFDSLQGVSTPTIVPPSATVTNFDPVTGTGGQFSPVLFDPNFKTPYSENFNLGIQQDLGHNMTFEVNYVGVHGFREFRVVDGNPPQPALVSQLVQFCSNPANSFGCTPATLQFSTLGTGAFPEFGSLIPFNAVNNTAFINGFGLNKSTGKSRYNGLQMNFTKRYAHGLQAQLAYTYSHSLDNSSDPLSPGGNSRALPRNSFNLRPEYGNSDFDVRHRAVLNFVYNPNVGRGKGHLNEGFVGRVFEGLEVASIATFQTGLPFDVFSNVDSQHTGVSDRGLLIAPNQLHVKPAGAGKTFTGVNILAFNDDNANPRFGTASNLHRNQFHGPGQNNWDAVMSKTTKFTEHVSFQLRAEVYNIFNRTAFGPPDGQLADVNSFGLSTSEVQRNDATTGARQIQFAAKLIF